MTKQEKETLARLWALMMKERAQAEIKELALQYLAAEKKAAEDIFRKGVRRQISAIDPVCPSCAHVHDFGLSSDIGSHEHVEEMMCEGCGLMLVVRSLVLCVTTIKRVDQGRSENVDEP